MSVSLYYGATRSTPLTTDERSQVDTLVEQYTATSTYGEEGLIFYADPEDGQILQGSTKMPVDLKMFEPILQHLFGALTAIRHAVPGADWLVTLDDTDVNWDETTGFSLPGIEASHDGDLRDGATFWQRLRKGLSGN